MSQIGYELSRFKNVWYLPPLVNASILLTAYLCYPEFSFLAGEDFKFYYYFVNRLADVGVFTFLQMIGWSLLNMICLLSAQLVPNKYLYPFTLLLLVVGTTLCIVALSVLPIGHREILGAISPMNLLAPGVFGLIEPASSFWRWMVVISCFALYSILGFILYQFVIHRRIQRG